MLTISNPKGWDGVNAVLSEFEGRFRAALAGIAIVWPLPSPSVATIKVTVLKRKGMPAQGFLIEVFCTFTEFKVAASALKQYRFKGDFVEFCLKKAQDVILSLLFPLSQPEARLAQSRAFHPLCFL